jgi:uncharacterized protein YndB with AHSA1/START domain
MTLREEIIIQRPAAKVWEILADPSLMAAWNPKCQAAAAGGQRVRLGLRFTATFQLSGPAQAMTGEIIACEPGQRLTTRFTGAAFPRDAYADETFVLEAAGTNTRLVQTVDYTHSGLPWFVKLLMKLLATFGHSVGNSSLDGIKELAEA